MSALCLTRPVSINWTHYIAFIKFIGWDNFFHGACAILKEKYFWERLCEIIFVMDQWFRLSYCLKIYFVLVLVAGYTVQQSISVCSILLSREF